jgi:hypothetical protein
VTLLSQPQTLKGHKLENTTHQIYKTGAAVAAVAAGPFSWLTLQKE